MSNSANVNKIIRERGDELLAKQNVVGVGEGKKNNIGDRSVVVLVKSKVSAEELDEQDLIPGEIDGVVTDVVEVGEIVADSACTHCDKERPVYGGLSCIWERGTACTLGAVVYKDQKPHLLMNTHCMNPHWKGAEVGDEIRQPSPNDGGRNKDRVGVSTAIFEELQFDGSVNEFDAGLCEVDEDIEVKPLFQEGIGEITNTPRTAERGEVVKKSGRTTGVTSTVVILTNATVNVNYDGKVARFEGQTIVENQNRHFGAGGDSSSLVVDANNNPVGLYFAGSPTIGIFAPIKPIIEKYKITFDNEPYTVPKYVFTKTLHIGDFGDEVVELQKVLKELGFFTYHTCTGYFGTITEDAVKAYQCDRGIVCEGDRFTTGYGQVGILTRASLNGEDPEGTPLLPLVERMKQQLIEIMGEAGQPIVVTSAYRSPEEQDKLYAKGRTEPGNIVTNARGGQSYHNWAVAFDIAFLSESAQLSAEMFNERMSEEYKEQLIEADAIHYNGDWAMVGAVGKALGLEWGGDWESFPDKPHFQYTAGYTLEDFKVGGINTDRFADYLA